MNKHFDIKQIQFYPGAYGGLNTKTAMVTIQINKNFFYKANINKKILSNINQIIPPDYFLNKKDKEFINNFLLQECEHATIAHWIVAITTHIQRLCKTPAYKGQVLNISKGVLQLALPWHYQFLFRESLELCIKILSKWLTLDEGKTLDDKYYTDFYKWIEEKKQNGLTTVTYRFALAALENQIPVFLFGNYLYLGYGKNMLRFEGTFTDTTSINAVHIASNKMLTKQFLQRYNIPVPKGILISSLKQLNNVVKALSYPLVVKPANQEQGRGITTKINSFDDLKLAVKKAKKFCKEIIIEEHILGKDYRLLIVNNELISAACREPVMVVGNGVDTIKELVSKLNSDPRRGTKENSLLKTIEINGELEDLLLKQNVTLSTVLKKEKAIYLKQTSNISQGATAIDVLDTVHPDNRKIAILAAQSLGIDITGVDLICEDISKSWKEVGAAIIEVNSKPGLRPHWLSETHIDTNDKILKEYFKDKITRIPICGITGTNGKTTTANILHHIWMKNNVKSGICTTNQLKLGHDIVSEENLSGQPGGELILSNNTIEAAVIEMPRKGLVIFGHPCDNYDVGILTNIQDDHIGTLGINTLEEMLEVKSRVLYRSNTLVLNVDDKLCFSVINKFHNKPIVAVSKDKKSSNFISCLNSKHRGISIDTINKEKWITLFENNYKNKIIRVDDIPATMNGTLKVNILNSMYAIAAAVAHKIDLDKIHFAMKSFKNDLEHNYGRYNFMEGYPFKILVDFAHNKEGVKKLAEFIKNYEIKGKFRICFNNIANRHRKHLAETIPIISKHFDEFYVGYNKKLILTRSDWEGEKPEKEMIKATQKLLLSNKVKKENIIVNGDINTLISMAIKKSKKDDFLVILTDPENIKFIQNIISER